MRNVKRIFLLAMAISLLAVGCSDRTEEKSGSLKEENADAKDLLTVDELIRITGISETDYGDMDLRQFIEDFEITEDNVNSLNVKPHMNKFTCFLVPPGGGSPLGGSDSLSTIGPELSHLTAVKPPGPRTG